MCEHCGCRGVRPIAELMDEHYVLLDLAGDIRRSLAAGDHPAAEAALRRLARLLARHVGREERGVLAAVKQQGDFAEAAGSTPTCWPMCCAPTGPGCVR